MTPSEVRTRRGYLAGLYMIQTHAGPWIENAIAKLEAQLSPEDVEHARDHAEKVLAMTDQDWDALSNTISRRDET